jgi:hypothetical protein
VSVRTPHSWCNIRPGAIEAHERIFAALNSSQQTAAELPQIRGLHADRNYITLTLGLLSAACC